MEDRAPKNLDRLFSSMTGYVEAKKQGKTFQSGKAPNLPDKYCTVCGAVFGSGPAEAPLKAYICGLCNQKLSEGQTAIVCGNRYAFIANSQSLADMAGKVVKVLPATMDALEKEYRDHVKHRQQPDEKLPSDRN